MSLHLNTPDDVVTLVGASIIPAHLLERAASHSRIRAAFNFVGATAFADEEDEDGEGAPVIEVTDEAAELIDSLLGKMVEEATDQASTLALLRHAAAEARKQQARIAGGAAVSIAATKPFPTTVAEARDVLSSNAGAGGAGKAVLTSKDVETYLQEVYPAAVAILPSSNPFDKLQDLNAAAVASIATIPPQPEFGRGQQQQQQQQQAALPSTGGGGAGGGGAGGAGQPGFDGSGVNALPPLSVSSAGGSGLQPAPSPAAFGGAGAAAAMSMLGPPPAKRRA